MRASPTASATDYETLRYYLFVFGSGSEKWTDSGCHWGSGSPIALEKGFVTPLMSDCGTLTDYWFASGSGSGKQKDSDCRLM